MQTYYECKRAFILIHSFIQKVKYNNEIIFIMKCAMEETGTYFLKDFQ